jgi:phospholipase/carboxylesterase
VSISQFAGFEFFSIYNKREVTVMLYRIDPHINSLKFYREPYSGNKLPYRKVKEMQEIYPDGKFVIIGEIGSVKLPPKDGDCLIISSGNQIPILPRGSHIKPLEWVTGYVAVGENTYLAVLEVCGKL